MTKTPRFFIHAFIDGQQEAYSAPIDARDRDYFARMSAALAPIDEAKYVESLGWMIGTAARFSYIFANSYTYWCVEWNPGLIVVRFEASGAMAAGAFRSPVPEFGGRTPLPQDEAAYDEDARAHQYSLVFDAWDAQFDAQKRQWGDFVSAMPGEVAQWEQFVAHADALGDRVERLRETGGIDFIANIDTWAGEGIRL